MPVIIIIALIGFWIILSAIIVIAAIMLSSHLSRLEEGTESWLTPEELPLEDDETSASQSTDPVEEPSGDHPAITPDDDDTAGQIPQ